ncbi:hypothetical protein [uncultured Algimonas sp.]|uniref:hypothetical protein n=1 Tax=uncultured Algimonas sp. TaxID=1547920 RepID=UPI00261B2532|nr:hypothetical protein [uncultured Algimonas sp.]
MTLSFSTTKIPVPKSSVTALLLAASLAACKADPENPAETSGTSETAIESVSAPQSLVLAERWMLDGFDAPESVIQTADGTAYYVSNVGGDGTARDNDGAISLISSDGLVIDRHWVTGTGSLPLHAPKGMALQDNRLFVTDIDHIVVIDVSQGRVVQRLPAANAGFLNDAAIGPNGTILISDSAAARIYQLENDDITVWLEDDRLGGINGLQMQDGRLLVTTMGAGELLSIDPATKSITGLATGMENADGIGLRSDGSYVISSWPGQLWHVRDGEAPVLLQDTSGEEGAVLMNDILLVDDTTLITPNWRPGTVRAYRVE